jgi:hypothetical protein
MEAERPSLVGRLAESWWVRRYSELTMTLALAHLLGRPGCARILAELVGQRTGAAMPVLTEWVTEPVQPDLGRPDVEAVLDGFEGAVPIVKIEAKLGAELTAGQLRSFADDQLRPRTSESPTNGGRTRFIVLVVPRSRMPDARRVLEELGAAPIGTTGREAAPRGFRLSAEEATPLQVAAIVTWKELADRFVTVAEQRCDAEAFRDLYAGLQAVAIAPFTVDDLIAPGWEEAADDVASVLKAATEGMFSGRVNPWRAEPPDFVGRRYVSRVSGSGDRTHFAVGVREPHPWHPTPAWLRYHPDTPDFASVQRRLAASLYSDMLIRDGGGPVWIPLYLPDDVSFETAVVAVKEQIERIDNAARGLPPPPKPRPLGAAEIGESFRQRRPVLRAKGGVVAFAEHGEEYALIIDESTLASLIDDPDGELAELSRPHGVAFLTPAARWAQAVTDGWVAKARRHHRRTGAPRRRAGHAHRPRREDAD